MPPTSQDGQRQLCLTVYLPCSTCPKMLCRFVHTSFSGSPFLSLSSSASFSISPSPYPVSHWWFVFFLWDLGSHSESALFSSYPFQRMGPEQQNGWVCPPPHPHTSPTHSSLLAMQWCHGFYLLWGYTLILSRYYTLHISHFQPPTLTNLHSCFPQPVHFPDSLASQRVPGGFGDVWMLFQTSSVHVRHPKERQPPFPMAVPVLNLIDLTLFCHPHISHYCRNNEVKTIIHLISTLLIWFFFCWSWFQRGCSASLLKCSGVRNLFHFEQDTLIVEQGAKSHPFIAVKLTDKPTCGK